MHPQNDDIETGGGTGSRRTVRFSKVPQRKDSEQGAWKMVSPIGTFVCIIPFLPTQTHVNVSLFQYIFVSVDGQGGISNHR